MGSDASSHPTEPLLLTLEFARARAGGDPFAFNQGPQEYNVRGGNGTYASARLDWDETLLADLAALAGTCASAEVNQRVGERLRGFLEVAPYLAIEPALLEGARAQRPIVLALRSAAAELYALPWELLALRPTGMLLGQAPGVVVRLAWPGTTPARPDPALQEAAPRVLMAWSAAGGGVPSGAQVQALSDAMAAAGLGLDPHADVLEGASLDGIVARLTEAARARRPFSGLHLLCHGAGGEGGGALVLDSPARGVADTVDGRALAAALGPFAPSLRLVHVVACAAGQSGPPGSTLGGVGLALHRAGLEAVLAPARPLRVVSANRWCAVFYQTLLAQRGSLDDAVRSARAAVGPDLDDAGAMPQLFQADEAESGSRPLALRPYRGLLAFERTDRPVFFGRDAELAELLRRVDALRQRPADRILVIAGASGAGKSSLLRAGLLPALEDRGYTVHFLRMDSTFESQLIHLPAPTEAPRALVVDSMDGLFMQFETADQRKAAVAALWAATGTGGSMLLATIRLDLLARCAEVQLPDGRPLDRVLFGEDHLWMLPAPGQAQLREAIEGPARLVGLRFDPGLVERLLDDAGAETSALPLLEHVLDRLWARREGRTLTDAAYREAGGLAGALAQSAERLIAGLSAEEVSATRLVLRTLTAVGPDRTPRRRRVLLAELPQVIDAALLARVLDRLVEGRLVVIDRAEQGASVELAHEALLLRWERLHTWVMADLELRARIGEVERWAEEWEAQGRHADYVLRGRRLGYALEIATRAPELRRGAAAALLAASEVVEVQAIAAAEAAIAERERLALRAQVAAVRARDAALLAMASACRAADTTRALLLLREVSEGEQSAAWAEEALAVLGQPYAAFAWRPPGAIPDLDGALDPRDANRTLTLVEGQAQVWRRGEEHPRVTLRGASALDAAWSPDGLLLATAGSDGQVRVWTEQGDAVRTMDAGRGPLRRVRFASDSRRLITVSEGGALDLFALDTGERAPLARLLGGARSLRLSPDGTRVAVVPDAEERAVRVWTAADGGTLACRGHLLAITGLCWSGDGRSLLSASEDGTARIWREGQCAATLTIGVALRAAAWSPDGAWIALGDSAGKVHLLPTMAGERPGQALLSQGELRSLSFDHRGDLHGLDTHGVLRSWRITRPSSLDVPRVLVRHPRRAVAVAWHPDGATVASGGADGTLSVAHALNDAPSAPFAAHDRGVRALAWSPAGDLLASAGEDGDTRLWTASGQRRVGSLDVHTGQVDGLCWISEHGLATGGQDSLIHLHDATRAQVTRTLEGHHNGIRALSVSRSGARLMSVSVDGLTRTWPLLDSGAPVEVGAALSRNRPTDPDAVMAAVFSGEDVLLGRQGGDVSRLAQGASAPERLGAHPSGVLAVAASPDGRWGASGDSGGQVRIWPLDPASPARVLSLDRGPVVQLRFAPAGWRLAARTEDGQVAVIADDGVGTPLWLRGVAAVDLCFDPTGDRLVIAAEDGSVAVWPVSTAALRALLVAASDCTLDTAERQRLLGASTVGD